jgi:hypothetical protein
MKEGTFYDFYEENFRCTELRKKEHSIAIYRR